MEAPAAMTWMVIGLILAVLVVVLIFTAGGGLTKDILAGSQNTVCNLPFLKC